MSNKFKTFSEVASVVVNGILFVSEVIELINKRNHNDSGLNHEQQQTTSPSE